MENQEIPVKHQKTHSKGDQAWGRLPRGVALESPSPEMLRLNRTGIPGTETSPGSVTPFPSPVRRRVLPEPSNGSSWQRSPRDSPAIPGKSFPSLSLLVSASHRPARIFPHSLHLPPQPLCFPPPSPATPAMGRWALSRPLRPPSPAENRAKPRAPVIFFVSQNN